MKQLCILLLLNFLISFNAFSQTGIIKGTVRDAQTKTALAGVSLYIPGNILNNTTNEWGSFTIEAMPVGTFEMNLTYIGYETEIRKVTIQENEITEVDIDLKPGQLELANVVVSGKNNNGSNTLAAIDIRLRPINNSQDILKMVPGLFIAQHAGGGKAEQIFLRGFDLDHGTDIQISVDGMPVNMVSHAHGQGYADLHFLIPEMVEKVRFEKGPYQSKAGNMATAGFVAFKTPDFMNNPFVKLEVGSFNTQRLAAAAPIITREKDGRHSQWWAAGEYTRSNQYFEQSQNLNRYNFLTKYSSQISDRSLFSFSASTFGSSWLASGQIPERAVRNGQIGRFGAINATEGGNTSRSNLNLSFQHILNEQWRLETRAWYSHYRFNLYSDFTFFLANPNTGDGIQQREKRDLFGKNTSLYNIGNLFNLPLETEFGFGFRQDIVNDLELNHAPYRQFMRHTQKGRVQETNLYSYFNSNLQLGTKLQANLGLRYDWFSFGYQDELLAQTKFNRQKGSVVSPKLNFQYDASRKVQLFLSSGIGFHSNDSRLILDQTVTNLIPRVYGVDAGILMKPTDRLLVKLGSWWMYSQQEFVYVGDAGIVEAGGASRRIGLDLSARMQFNNWLFADADMNLTRARSVGEPKGNDFIPLAANLTSTGGLTAKTKNGLSGSLRYRWIGDRPANEDNSVIADGYFLLDAMASYRYKKMELGISLQNLLNAEWNEAQFNTESRLRNEANPVSEIHFTPGSPLFARVSFTYFF